MFFFPPVFNLLRLMYILPDYTFFSPTELQYVDTCYSAPEPLYSKNSIKPLSDSLNVAKSALIAIVGKKFFSFDEPKEPFASIMLLGTMTLKKKSYIFYSLAKDITKNPNSLIRGYAKEKENYLAAYKEVSKYLQMIYRPIFKGNILFSAPCKPQIISDVYETIGRRIFSYYQNLMSFCEKKEVKDKIATDALKRIARAIYEIGEGGENHRRKKAKRIEKMWDRFFAKIFYGKNRSSGSRDSSIFNLYLCLCSANNR